MLDLRALQRDLGVEQQLGADGFGVGQPHEARPGRELQALARHHEGLHEQRADAVAVDQRLRAQQAEGIGGDAGHGGVEAELVAHALHHGLQDLVAEAVAEGVVDLGEVVEVDQRQRHALRRLEVLLEHLDEARAVGQVQELVVVGVVQQLAVEHDVLEAHGDVGAEGAQQLLVQLLQRPADIDHGRHGPAVAQAEVEAGDVLVEAALLLQAAFQHLADAGDLHGAQRRVDQAAVLAGGPDDARRLALVAAHVGADQALGQDAQQGAQLRDDAFGEAVDAVHAAQLGAGLDDQLEPLAVGLECADLAVGADGGRQHGVQPRAGQLRLGLVVVDVVGLDGLDLGRVARLAGAQHDAHGAQLELVTDESHQLQAGVLGFHHHVQQHDGEVGLAGEHVARGGGGVGVQEAQRHALDAQALHGELGGLVDVGVVVDDQDAPGRQIASTLVLVVVFGAVQKLEQVIVVLGDAGCRCQAVVLRHEADPVRRRRCR